MSSERDSSLGGRAAPALGVPPTADDSKRRERKKRRIVVLAVVIAGLAFAAGWTPPAKTAHDFTKASDYNAKRERGCTNSGKGCHGSEKEYVDFNAYHPDTACTVCHEYDGVGCIPCHKPRQHECAACHDGTMEGASDTVRLSDPYPRGHYRESSHTAMGTSMSDVVRSVEGGEAKLECRDCHARDLRDAHRDVPVVDGSPYGEDIGCGECHNDERSYGLEQVLADWRKRRCEDCHRKGSSSPMHPAAVPDSGDGQGAQGCGKTGPGCHATNKLHALHPDEPAGCAGSAAKGEPGCHDLKKESHKPTATSCGKGAKSCHGGYVSDSYGHENDRSVHSPKTGRPAGDTSYHGIPCGSCHFMSPDGRSLVVEHGLPTSARDLVPGNGCRDCHNDPASQVAIADKWAARDTGNACTVCHDGVTLAAPHDRGLSAAHTVYAGSDGCASTGAGCHPTADLSVVGDPLDGAIHRHCLRCHDRTASGDNMPYRPDRTTCGAGRDCHAGPGDYDPATGRHAGAGGPADGEDRAHHQAGSVQSDDRLVHRASGVSTRCGSCHSMILGDEHTRPNASLGAVDACLGCHNAGATPAATVKSDWTAKDTDEACAACHGGAASHGSPDAMHRAVQYSYDNRVSSSACARSACHSTADVRVLHKAAGCTLAGCHRATGDIRGSRKRGCGGTDAIAGGACHTNGKRHRKADAAHVATERDPYGNLEPGSCLRPGCHATLDVRDLHKKDGCSTPGCHVPGGPTYMTCGGSAGQQSCHTSGNRHRSAEASHQAAEYDKFGVARPGSCAQPGCHPTVDVRAIHKTKSCLTPGCHVEGGPTYMSCGGIDGQSNCHTGSNRHRSLDASHQATELGTTGTVQPGACTRSGCHTTVDVRVLHKKKSCQNPGCHVEGGPTLMTCGGTVSNLSCHNPPPPKTCTVVPPTPVRAPPRPDITTATAETSPTPTGVETDTPDGTTSAAPPPDREEATAAPEGTGASEETRTPEETSTGSGSAKERAKDDERDPQTETPKEPAGTETPAGSSTMTKGRSGAGPAPAPPREHPLSRHERMPSDTLSGPSSGRRVCLECHAVKAGDGSTIRPGLDFPRR